MLAYSVYYGGVIEEPLKCLNKDGWLGGLKSTYYILTVLGVGMDCVVLVVSVDTS